MSVLRLFGVNKPQTVTDIPEIKLLYSNNTRQKLANSPYEFMGGHYPDNTALCIVVLLYCVAWVLG